MESSIQGRTLAEETAAAKWLGWPLDRMRRMKHDSVVAEAFRAIEEPS